MGVGDEQLQGVSRDMEPVLLKKGSTVRSFGVVVVTALWQGE
jgi:hypothetical protein